MDLRKARARIEQYAREQFGRIVALRDVSVVRRAGGRARVGELYCATKHGEVMVGRIGVTAGGAILGGFGVDQLIEALAEVRQVEHLDGHPDGEPLSGALQTDDELLDFALDDLEEVEPNPDDEIDRFFNALDGSHVQGQVSTLLASDSPEDLHQARELLPSLLTRPEDRGSVLRQMGEVELKLNAVELGLNYFEAAAREFVDRAEIEALEGVAGQVLQAIGEAAFAQHPIKGLLDYARARQTPVEQLGDSMVFSGLGERELQEIEAASRLLTVQPEEILLREGEPAARAFVVKSGTLAICLEPPHGGTRVVRCCFPRDFVGESGAIGRPGATCNATVQAQCLTTVWSFEADTLRRIAAAYPAVLRRLESARALKRLDSFFSVNEATETLDVRVRDQLLSCVTAIRDAGLDEQLGRTGAIPDEAYLIVSGKVAVQRPGVEDRIRGADSFLGLRDVLHGLAQEMVFTVVEPCRLVCFDGNKLRSWVAGAPPEVAAVLERLE